MSETSEDLLQTDSQTALDLEKWVRADPLPSSDSGDGLNGEPRAIGQASEGESESGQINLQQAFAQRLADLESLLSSASAGAALHSEGAFELTRIAHRLVSIMEAAEWMESFGEDGELSGEYYAAYLKEKNLFVAHYVAMARKLDVLLAGLRAAARASALKAHEYRASATRALAAKDRLIEIERIRISEVGIADDRIAGTERETGTTGEGISEDGTADEQH